MSKQKNEYISRINKVIDYIEQNISEEMNLGKLASVANFSEYHFHRIFSAIVGEPLNKFIQRIRIEKSAVMLITHPDATVTEIALTFGFKNSSVYSRSFKSAFGMSPSEWRESKKTKYSKNDQIDSKHGIEESKQGKTVTVIYEYFGGVNQNQLWRLQMQDQKEIQVEVKELPEQTVAYVRHIGPYKQNVELFKNLISKMCTWAGPRGLLTEDAKMMSVYHDDPEITDEAKLRLSVCLTVPEDTKVEGEIGKMHIAGGKYACARFEIFDNEYLDAWQMVYRDWLPESGYQPTDEPCFELYLNDPQKHPEGKHIFDICIPVKPL